MLTIPISLVIFLQCPYADDILMQIALLHEINNALPDLRPVVSNMEIHVRMELVQEHEPNHIIEINKRLTGYTITTVFKSTFRYLNR